MNTGLRRKKLRAMFKLKTKAQRQRSRLTLTRQVIFPFPDDQIPAEIHVAMAEQKRKIPLARNSACPCGSGKRFKKCHWEKPGKAAMA